MIFKVPSESQILILTEPAGMVIAHQRATAATVPRITGKAPEHQTLYTSVSERALTHWKWQYSRRGEDVGPKTRWPRFKTQLCHYELPDLQQVS